MELKPSEDVKINIYKLDEESANISELINAYDNQWNKAILRLGKLDAQIKNLEDELKNLRQSLSFIARKDWSLSGFDQKPTDKLAESWAYTTPEYKEKFEQLKVKREERAEEAANEALYKNFHFVLLEKSKNIELQFKMWGSQYSTVKNGSPETKEEKQSEGINALTKKIKRKINV